MRDKFKRARMTSVVRLLKPTGLFILPVAASVLAMGCGPGGIPTSVSAPTANAIFEPDPVTPGNSFGTDSGTVSVFGLNVTNVTSQVCYTTDGSDPTGCDNVLTSGSIAIDCGSDTGATTVRTVSLAFSWDDSLGNVTDELRSGNYFLDCTPPPADSDADGIPDTEDNCPSIYNPGQEDENGIDDGVGQGDACEAEPIDDADGDTKEDGFDNCEFVWNYDQADADNDGLGNVCDPEPLGPPVMPLANGDLAAGFVDWMDEVRCNIRCSDPTGGGDMGTYSCPGGGNANWNVVVDIFGGSADSVFTYSNCNYTTNAGVNIVVDGVLTQLSDFNGNGTEIGDVNVGGDYTGAITSHSRFNNRVRSSGAYYSVGCTDDPSPGKECAANGVKVDYYHSDWTCQGSDPLCVEGSEPLVDSDSDGVFDQYDNCPNTANSDQANDDFDMEGNACDATNSSEDADGDLVPDSVDNCPDDANPNQADADNDGIGDVCDLVFDPDTDGDGVPDNTDNCDFDANADQADADSDGEGDVCDLTPNGPDGDNDGVPDGQDNCPNDNNPSQSDIDSDGEGDVCDDSPGFVQILFKEGGANDYKCVKTEEGHDIWGSDTRTGTGCSTSNNKNNWTIRTVPGAAAGSIQIESMEAPGKCWRAITTLGWPNISLATCDDINSVGTRQRWIIERYDEANGVTFDLRFPSRIRNENGGQWCVYSGDGDNTFGTFGNCALGLGEGKRQVGIYFGGDFYNSEPYEP